MWNDTIALDGALIGFLEDPLEIDVYDSLNRKLPLGHAALELGFLASHPSKRNFELELDGLPQVVVCLCASLARDKAMSIRF